MSKPSLSVQIAGAKYQTLPWFLGRVPTKTDKTIANEHGSRGLVELRHGNHNTPSRYHGQAILRQGCAGKFRSNEWASTTCRPTRLDRDSLEARLVPERVGPLTSNFLWRTESLRRAFDEQKMFASCREFSGLSGCDGGPSFHIWHPCWRPSTTAPAHFPHALFIASRALRFRTGRAVPRFGTGVPHSSSSFCKELGCQNVASPNPRPAAQCHPHYRKIQMSWLISRKLRDELGMHT